jgi:hypothetical protein
MGGIGRDELNSLCNGYLKLFLDALAWEIEEVSVAVEIGLLFQWRFVLLHWI